MRRYYGTFGHSIGKQNTCSIKFLKNAYIGVTVRMTGDKTCVKFENNPMKGVKITGYDKLGFTVEHPNLPRVVWLAFDQMPLTRLTIVNGVIQDEITFVENIVNHQMQFIKTNDSEYIDLIYKDKALKEKEEKREIIPVTKGIVGRYYIGAQCEDGVPMVFMGIFYCKDGGIHQPYDYSNYNKPQTWLIPKAIYVSKLSPQRAFFAVPISSDPTNGTTYHFKEYAITSKRIKDLIIVSKTDDNFADEQLNRDIILAQFYKSCANYPMPTIPYKVSKGDYPHYNPSLPAVSKDKNELFELAKELSHYHGVPLCDNISWEDKPRYQPNTYSSYYQKTPVEVITNTPENTIKILNLPKGG